MYVSSVRLFRHSSCLRPFRIKAFIACKGERIQYINIQTQVVYTNLGHPAFGECVTQSDVLILTKELFT